MRGLDWQMLVDAISVWIARGCWFKDSLYIRTETMVTEFSLRFALTSAEQEEPKAKLFNGYFLALAKATGITNPKHIPILKQDFWVQVKGLPFGYITRTVGKIIDDALGGYMSLVLRLNGEPIEIDVRYENLPTACYRYGIIGHTELSCLMLNGHEYPRLTGRQFGFPSSSGWSRPALKEDASSSAMVEDSGSTKSSMPNQLATNALQNLEGFQTEEALALTQPFPRPSPKISRPK
ncbi:unnamed protein product [Prunus armeniaca]|uniref:Uncharacterized protein n=1 Tax=Prunus armeniaca TaxID=36596 RepID=A0A6J5V0T9_PRUAR|nr:unnamed protein product [Prunus armeniaca]CAB4312948.1 unnamed protein product [Prunus armeniaca]